MHEARLASKAAREGDVGESAKHPENHGGQLADVGIHEVAAVLPALQPNPVEAGIFNVEIVDHYFAKAQQRHDDPRGFVKEKLEDEGADTVQGKPEGRRTASRSDGKNRAENGLSSYRLSSRERRKHIRAKIRRILGFPPRKRKPKVDGPAFPTIIDALRIEAQERRHRLVQLNEELVSFGS
ncbi:hypothetical protein [Sinorhizobium terangae]|uniref:hypothetical protein n=1 Tax=Sinorhizobium terangae TaxID=110322 RepID=UPI0024B0E9C8|nr:hypothetical protein [Sinorhizobium terangae]WFU49490.1 hypothetical protein QA637_08885 [Sinorhizobium terangae]